MNICGHCNGIALAMSLALGACSSTGTPQIVTKEVKVMVPVPCAANVEKPAAAIVHSTGELRTMLNAAPNVTERARIVSDQLLLWLVYGSQLEAANEACSTISSQPSE